MDSNARLPDLARSLLLAAGLNMAMVFLPFFGIGPRSRQVLAGISDALAAPPGMLIKHIADRRKFLLVLVTFRRLIARVGLSLVSGLAEKTR